MNLTTIIVGIIGLLIILGFFSQIQLTYTLNKWLHQVELQLAAPGHATIEVPWIRDAIEDYKSSASSQQIINTQALIESYFYKQPIRLLGLFPVPIGNAAKLLSHLPSFTIILGVLGTFVGLTESMFAMQNALLSMSGSVQSQVTINSILTTIASPFKGMSLAFITSIAGIGASLILNLIQGGFLSKGQSISYLSEKLLIALESLLDHAVQKEVREGKPNDWFESVLDRLAGRISESFHETLGGFSENIVTFTDELKTSVDHLGHLLDDFGAHREALLQSSTQLITFGDQFKESTDQYKDINQGVSSQIDRLKDSVDRVFTRVEQQEKRSDQQAKQMAQLLENSQKQTESLSRQFLQALEQQMQSFHEKYDHAAESLSRQQEDWLYQHRDMNNQYAQGSETMVHAVEQLERGLIQSLEKMKREVLDQAKYQQERQMQLFTRDQDRNDGRDIIRAFDQLSHGIDRGFDDERRYFQEFIQLLSRVASLLEHQSRTSNSLDHRTLTTTRVIDS